MRTVVLFLWPAGPFPLVAVPSSGTPCGPAPGAVVPSWCVARLFVLPTLGLVWHPVDLASPDRAAARGQPSTQPPPALAQLCPRAAVW